jgi:hypothetical protein
MTKKEIKADLIKLMNKLDLSSSELENKLFAKLNDIVV